MIIILNDFIHFKNFCNFHKLPSEAIKLLVNFLKFKRIRNDEINFFHADKEVGENFFIIVLKGEIKVRYIPNEAKIDRNLNNNNETKYFDGFKSYKNLPSQNLVDLINLSNSNSNTNIKNKTQKEFFYDWE